MENEAHRLPASCAIGDDTNAGALLIWRGQPGFRFWHSVIAEHYNRAFSVTPAQISAMLLGALTGWDTPLINADLFDISTGLFITLPREVGLCAFWCAAHELSGQVDEDSRLPPRLSAEAHEFIRENRQQLIAWIRWRSFYIAEVKAAEEAFR
jgi:hypothetical protein